MKRRKVTSIGNSALSRPKNKNQKSKKRYRGQGRHRKHRW